MTALVAGHETTASQLAWAFERLAREPAVMRRLTAELDEGAGDAYLTASIQEILRLKPVLAEAEPRVVKRTVEIGGVEYPPGVALVASAYLVHRDPDIYPQPRAFRPERFLEREGGPADAGGRGPTVHVDPVRGRTHALSGRELRAARDEGGAERGASGLRDRAGRSCARAHPQAQHHPQPRGSGDRHPERAHPQASARRRARVGQLSSANSASSPESCS